jgi:hypothetical protein
MILGAELGLLIYGIYVLIKGQYSLGKGKKVIGRRARILGAVCLIPIPLSMIMGFVIGFLYSEAVAGGQLKGVMAGLEAGILICTVIVLVVLSKYFFNQQQVLDESTGSAA